MRRFVLISSSAVLLTLPIASAAIAEDINSALARTYRSNPTLNIQRAMVRVVDETVPQAKVPFRPQIFASANAGLSRTVFRSAITDTTSSNNLTPASVSITINQTLFNGFQTINNVRAAEANIRASREALRTVEQDVLLSAATAYSDVLLGKETVKIRERDISFLEEQVRSSQARLDVGEATRTDLAQSQAQAALARALLSTAQADLQAANATYRQIVGRSPSALTNPRPPVKLFPANLTRALEIAAVEHPATKATQHLVDMAAFNVKTSEGALLPTVTLNGTASQSINSQSQGDSSTSGSATVSVNVPLYQGGGVASSIRQGKETLGQRRIEVDQSRDQVRNSVVASWTALISARATIKSNQLQVDAANLALEGIIEERNVGQRTQLEVLQSRSTLLAAELQLISAKRNRIVAGYSLLSSVGRLSAQRLGLAVRVYKPKEHYEKVKDLWYGLRTPSGK